jgi:hypothetical protein
MRNFETKRQRAGHISIRCEGALPFLAPANQGLSHISRMAATYLGSSTYGISYDGWGFPPASMRTLRLRLTD